MAANRLEKWTPVKVNRKHIHGADYNPRKINKEAAKKLRKELNEIGLLAPIVVNSRTMNIVSGHQRIDAMDTLLRKDDYEITVAMVELDEEAEVKANILMNNPSVMGEWDNEKLVGIHEMFPTIDFKADLGFDQFDLDFMFSGTDQFEEVTGIFDTPAQTETKDALAKMAELDKLKQAKREYRAEQAEANKTGDTYQVQENDYYVTFVFNNNTEKREFMQRIRQKTTEKFLKSSVLYDIYDRKYQLTGKLE